MPICQAQVWVKWHDFFVNYSWRVASTCFAFCHLTWTGQLEARQVTQEVPTMLHCLAYSPTLSPTESLLGPLLPAKRRDSRWTLNRKDVIPWRYWTQRRCLDGSLHHYCHRPFLGPRGKSPVSSPAGCRNPDWVTTGFTPSGSLGLTSSLSLSLSLCVSPFRVFWVETLMFVVFVFASWETKM